MYNRVVHFEIPCDRPAKTMKFFEEVFSWNFQQFGEDEYWFAVSGDSSTPGINGAVMAKKDPKQPMVNSIVVESIDETAEKIVSSGGQIVLPKMEVPGVGWLCYFTDPDGNIHGIWQELNG
ncbi:MAG: glyoxalase [Ignavibacteriae bacterium HGW-Ignavibacteriae-1]|jgi:hypothetical protein|nr:MAG: glyoxalase [Ignavibacteriae bacterium HGW-Ignavibacteriae-1]